MSNDNFDDFEDEFDDLEDDLDSDNTTKFTAPMKKNNKLSNSLPLIVFSLIIISGAYFAYNFVMNYREQQSKNRLEKRSSIAERQQEKQINNIEVDFGIVGDEQDLSKEKPFKPLRKTLSEADLNLDKKENNNNNLKPGAEETSKAEQDTKDTAKADKSVKSNTTQVGDMQPDLDLLLQEEASKLGLNETKNVEENKVTTSQEDSFATKNDEKLEKLSDNDTSDKVAKVQALSDEFKDTVDSLAEEVTLNVNQIKELETAVETITNTLNRISQTVNKLDTKMTGIDNNISNLSNDISNVKKVMRDEDLDLTVRKQSANAVDSNNITNDPVVYSSPDYVVHAIIKGRAWLKSSGGQIITVTEGDSVGDFGRIAVIDSVHNVVRTSSGITFR